MKEPETLAKKTGRVLLTVIAVLALFAGVVLIVAWRAASLEIEAAPYRLDAVQTVQTHDFSVDLPADWQMTGFSGLVKWPDKYLVFMETWLPDRNEAQRQFEHILGLAEQKDSEEQFRDISGRLGRAAVIAPQAYQPDGPKWQTVATMIISYPHGRLQLFQMGDKTPPDRGAADEQFIEAAGEFLPFYSLDDETVEPGLDGGRTAFGSVMIENRAPFDYSINSASFTFDGGTFYLAGLTGDRLLTQRPGFTSKLSRFFGELDRSGVISGSSFHYMPLDGRAGDETIRKHPYFDQGDFTLEMDWQARPSAENPLTPTPSFALTADEVTVEKQAEIMGLWRAILSSLRFAKN